MSRITDGLSIANFLFVSHPLTAIFLAYLKSNVENNVYCKSHLCFQLKYCNGEKLFTNEITMFYIM